MCIFQRSSGQHIQLVLGLITKAGFGGSMQAIMHGRATVVFIGLVIYAEDDVVKHVVRVHPVRRHVPVQTPHSGTCMRVG